MERVHYMLFIFLYFVVFLKCNVFPFSDNKANLEDDEQLARALQESLNSESPRHQNGRIYRPFPNFFPPVYRYLSYGCLLVISLCLVYTARILLAVIKISNI